MKVISTQFFINHSELSEFVEKMRISNDLNIGFIEKKPTSHTFGIKTFCIKENINYNSLLKSSARIVFSINDFNLSNTEKPYLFLENNPNILSITIGEETKTFLKESWLSSLKILTDENSFKLWKKIERELKKLIISGGYSVFEPTENRKFERTLKYTNGAKKAFEKGLKILPSSGKNIHFELTKEN
ncbi:MULTISPECIES: hypothetical protein [unclassified Lacinutrix]